MTGSPPRPAGVVLVGGASRRMGRDKATLVVDGTELAARVAGALRAGGCAPVEYQGGDPDALAQLGLPVHPDRAPGAGPVPAIADALARHDDTGVLIAACDLPDLTAGSVERLIRSGRDGRTTIAATGNRHHLVVYAPPGSRRRWDDVATAGVVALRDAATALGALPIEVPPDDVRNVNTPDDL